MAARAEGVEHPSVWRLLTTQNFNILRDLQTYTYIDILHIL